MHEACLPVMADSPILMSLSMRLQQVRCCPAPPAEPVLHLLYLATLPLSNGLLTHHVKVVLNRGSSCSPATAGGTETTGGAIIEALSRQQETQGKTSK